VKYRNRGWRTAAVAVALSMVAAACSGDGSSGGSGEAAGTGSDAPVEIRWFVGLGAGSDEATIPAQEAVVEEFNASQDDIVLKLEIVDNDQAYDVLNTQIAGGNAPDIVGPMGIRGRASFPGAWLDLQPLVDSAGYDLSDFDPALVDFYRIEDEGLVGLPFAVFPSFMFVNLDLFDEAGLPYPPQEYGAPYVDVDGVEHEWDIDTMQELAMQLTVDGNGNDANSPDFDPDSIVQFGFGNMWTDARGQATLFGPGNFVDEDGNAVIPDHWRDAFEWIQDAQWSSYFHPNGVYAESDILGGGNWFDSGNLAMANTHLWYATCCMGGLNASWDTAVVPAYQGETTAKLHADTFSILRSTDHPEEAFEVLTYLLGPAAEQLTKTYGGMPARFSLQDGYFEAVNEETFPGQDINWDVVTESLAYPDSPSHEADMPAFLEASDRYNQFGTLLTQDPTLDVQAALDELQADLQRIFDSAG
jgi:multiple sugar transport system substrate-binding protein